MSKNQEIPITDSELDDLMAELEAETADMVVVPVVAAAPTPEPEPDLDDELAALEAEEVAAAPEPVVAAIAAPPVDMVMAGKLEKAAAMLKAKAAPAPAPEPEVEFVFLTGKAALAAVEAALEEETSTAPAAPAPNPIKPAGLSHYIDMAAFKDEIRISSSNIDTAMMEQAGLSAYMASEAAQAEAQASRLKLRFEIVEAALYKKHRLALAAGTEKVTEKMIEMEVKLDPEYVAGKNRVIEGEMIAATRKGCNIAMRDRKDMLVQIGADRREEGKGQLRMLEQDAGHNDAKARGLRAAS